MSDLMPWVQHKPECAILLEAHRKYQAEHSLAPVGPAPTVPVECSCGLASILPERRRA